MSEPPLVLAILDGFGEAPASDTNAISRAAPRTWSSLRERFPWTTIDASGGAVGLPCSQMGNSEVGHMNIGAGRVVLQDITRIDHAIEQGDFQRNDAILGAIEVARAGHRLHLLGLVSDGGVHSSHRHLRALLELCAGRGLRGDQVVVHAFLDGRDTAPRASLEHVAGVQESMAELGVGELGTVAGRYFAMDRDQRWDRVQRAWDAMTVGAGDRADSATAAIEASHAAGAGDEFVPPTVIGDPAERRIRDGDAVFVFNFRADRVRQISEAFLKDDFDGFERRARPRVHYATMTRYHADFDCPVAFPPRHLRGGLAQAVSEAGLRQLRIAETEKYAHVTYFFSGGDEAELPGERRILVPSPRVATYDMQPEMSAGEVTERVIAELRSEAPPHLVVLNFANPDMVGHTGVLDAAVVAVETVDRCLARVHEAVRDGGGTLVVTADHGNCEQMVDPVTGKPHTAHTTNPVPLLIASERLRNASLRSGGRLCDIATTLLPLLGLEPGDEMDGTDLLGGPR